ncbi:hypothetical protein BJX70DRAFT_394351 [Aspergillus crustosus]
MTDSPPMVEDDHLAAFRHVYATLRLDLLPEFVSGLRQKILSQKSPIGCKVNPEPVFGSHHILFQIDFIDEARWMIKVPANGYERAFDELSARALESEALTMELIKRKTTIPIPEVFDFSSTCDNPLGCSFILMEYVDGRPLYDAWFDRSIAPDILQQHRDQALRGIAEAMIQLQKFTFQQGGTVLFGTDGNPSGDVGPFRTVDVNAMLDNLREDDTYDGSHVFHEIAPISDVKSYFTYALNRREPPSDEFSQGIYRLLNLFIDLAVKECQSQHKEEKKFILSHPDFDIQNIIVSKTDGSLLGIIDWDGVIAVPRCVSGNEGYPSWLTRDWDPAKYMYRDKTDPDSEDAGSIYESSPAELASFRRRYQEIVAEVSNNPLSKNTTHDSLFLSNLKIAADDPVCTDGIIGKIFDEIKAKTSVLGSSVANEVTDSQNERDSVKRESFEQENVTLEKSDSEEDDDDDDDDDDFYLYEVCTDLVKGELEKEQLERLVKGFKALFLHDTDTPLDVK